MKGLLVAAAFATFGIGLAHSVLGERFILMRLFRRGNLPKLLGSEQFTKGTLRFAWHLTTLTWWGIAVLIYSLSQTTITASLVALVIAVIFLLSGAAALIASRGKHFAWPVFLFIGVVCLNAALA